MASFTEYWMCITKRRTLNFSHITHWSITQVSKSFADFEFQSGGGGAAIKIAILWNNLSVWHPHLQSYHISEKNILIKVCRSRTVYANCLFGHRITAAAAAGSCKEDTMCFNIQDVKVLVTNSKGKSSSMYHLMNGIDPFFHWWMMLQDITQWALEFAKK